MGKKVNLPCKPDVEGVGAIESALGTLDFKNDRPGGGDEPFTSNQQDPDSDDEPFTVRVCIFYKPKMRTAVEKWIMLKAQYPNDEQENERLLLWRSFLHGFDWDDTFALCFQSRFVIPRFEEYAWNGLDSDKCCSGTDCHPDCVTNGFCWLEEVGVQYPFRRDQRHDGEQGDD